MSPLFAMTVAFGIALPCLAFAQSYVPLPAMAGDQAALLMTASRTTSPASSLITPTPAKSTQLAATAVASTEAPGN